MGARAGDTQRTYSIAVQGRLDESWSGWLGSMVVVAGGADEEVPVTTLTGPVADQPALRGILNRLWDLNLTLISVNPVSEGSGCEEANR